MNLRGHPPSDLPRCRSGGWRQVAGGVVPDKCAAFLRGVHARIALALLAAGIVLNGINAAEPARISEYELKAAILPKLPLFMTWPENAFHDAGSPVRIGVFGPNPFGNYLQEAVRGKKAGIRQF